MEQKENKRRSLSITVDGVAMPSLVVAAKKINIKHITLSKRFSRSELPFYSEKINGYEICIKVIG